jgi:hypothetical protein
MHPGWVAEIGFLETFEEPRVFALQFEGSSSLLLSLERSFCSHLHILGWELASALKTHLEVSTSHVVLVHRTIAHLGLGSVTYPSGVSPPPGALTLVLGSATFLTVAAVRPGMRPALFLLSSHRPSKRPLFGPARRRLLHRNVGGPTHFVATFGCQGITYVPVEMGLRRSVGHIFDFRVRPDLLSLSDRNDPSVGLSIYGILHPPDLVCPIHHQTTYYRMVGSRALCCLLTNLALHLASRLGFAPEDYCSTCSCAFFCKLWMLASVRFFKSHHLFLLCSLRTSAVGSSHFRGDLAAQPSVVLTRLLGPFF